MNTAHPLDGAQLKLARADTHLNCIKDAVEETPEGGPDLIPGEFDKDRGEYLFRALRDSRSPDWLSPIIGDCVHNFRTALDYLVWELVATTGATGTTKTEFPIFTDPGKYGQDAPRKIKGVPPLSVALFERLQPFAGPNSQPGHPQWREPEREPLALLYELDKWDKHRSLNLTEDVARGLICGVERYGFRTAPTPSIIPGRFKRGAVIARLVVGADRPEMDVHLSTTYNIAFERGGPAVGEPLVQTLTHIRQEVRERIFPAFAQFFP